ncbi:MAG: PLDc N-terminal domain-containing protein [Methanolobus sp.]|nr:PLDc N-terminal domain-containing protein [Methanolobus sp.]
MLDALFIGIPFLMVFIIFGVGIIGTVFWVWMLLDCAMKEPSEGNDKLIWVIIILFTHLLGALLYFLVRRPKRIQEYGR